MHSSPIVAILIVATALLSGGPAVARAQTPSTSQVEKVNYRGWNTALRLQNAPAEVVVVPEIGRVMSFRFRDGENVFWEESSLASRRGDVTGKEWINFGGDKTWPAPEAEWKNYTKQTDWMPPPAFDALPVTAQIVDNNSAIILTSPIDPFYGVRTVRRITLLKNAPVMSIETSYERVSGEPSKIGIWVITQFKDPVAVCVPVPKTSMFPHGYFVFRDTPWPQLKTAAGMINLTRDPGSSHKLGSDADRMLWIGETAMCLVSSPRVPGAEYPDRGASAEVYTNPDPKKYVELETLGPLALLKPGGSIRQTNTYTLMRRTGENPDADARRVFAGVSR